MTYIIYIIHDLQGKNKFGPGPEKVLRARAEGLGPLMRARTWEIKSTKQVYLLFTYICIVVVVV